MDVCLFVILYVAVSMCLCLSIQEKEKEEYSREVEGIRAKGNPSSTFIAYATFLNRVFSPEEQQVKQLVLKQRRD